MCDAFIRKLQDERLRHRGVVRGRVGMTAERLIQEEKTQGVMKIYSQAIPAIGKECYMKVSPL
jgi:hypothetical protein